MLIIGGTMQGGARRSNNVPHILKMTKFLMMTKVTKILKMTEMKMTKVKFLSLKFVIVNNNERTEFLDLSPSPDQRQKRQKLSDIFPKIVDLGMTIVGCGLAILVSNDMLFPR